MSDIQRALVGLSAALGAVNAVIIGAGVVSTTVETLLVAVAAGLAAASATYFIKGEEDE